MKNLFCLAMLMFLSYTGHSQIKLLDGNNVGIGTYTPQHKLDVNGICQVRGRYLLVGKAAGSLTANIRVGANRTAQGASILDMVSGDAYTDYGTRFARYQTGTGALEHRGTLPMLFRNKNFADQIFYTNSAQRMRIMGNGRVGIARTPTNYVFEVKGTPAKTTAGGDWVQVSDRRLKTKIRPYTEGIEQIMELEPKWFQYNGKAGTDTGVDYVGLIAQDLQKVAPHTVKEFTYTAYETDDSGDDFSERVVSEKEYLSIDASAIRYMLVNAVQEQQKIITDQTDQIETQETEINTLEDRVTRLEQALETIIADASIPTSEQTIVLERDKAQLQQNSPNPFHETTVISYFVPEKMNNASLEIFDINGALLKQIRITETGNGNLTIQAKELAAGTYMYQLKIDGQVIDTKKMVLTRN